MRALKSSGKHSQNSGGVSNITNYIKVHGFEMSTYKCDAHVSTNFGP